MMPHARPTRMPRQGLSWPVVMVVLAVVVVAGTMWWQMREAARKAQIVAKVEGHDLTRSDLAEALRAHLWVRGEKWAALPPDQKSQRKEEALQSLVEGKVLGAWAVKHTTPGLTQAGDDALQSFLKQFEEPGIWLKRAGWQHHTEATLQAWIEGETQQRLALEAALTNTVPKVTDAEAKAWLQEHATQMQIPERVRASHIFLSRHDREKPDRTLEIQECHRRLVAGEITLSALAGELSEDSRSNKLGGSLGWFSKDRVPEEFGTQVFAMKMGELSTPVETRLGWHIVLVHEKRSARAPKSEEAKAEVVALLQSQRRAEAAASLRKDLMEKAMVERFPAHIMEVEPLQ